MSSASNFISGLKMSILGKSPGDSSVSKGLLVSTSSALNTKVKEDISKIWTKANSIVVTADGNTVITAGHVDAVLKVHTVNAKECHVLHGHNSR